MMNMAAITKTAVRIPETMWKFLLASVMSAPEYRIHIPQTMVLNNRMPVMDIEMI